MWEKVIHVKSSMDKKPNQWTLCIGRFQPLHLGHQEMFQQIMDEGGNVCIGIRDMQPDEKNPFTAAEVYANIHDFYKDLIVAGRVKVIKMPDINAVAFGRGVGYDIVEWIPPQDIAQISATKIREQLKMQQDGSSCTS